MTTEDVKNITVLGTGNMGPGIAVLFARGGYDTLVWAHSRAGQDKAREDSIRNVDDLVTNGLLTKDDTTEILDRIKITMDLGEAVETADFISESVVEDLGVKRDLFRRVLEYCKSNAVIVSNTSTLLPSRLQEGLQRPDRILVAHFWNPAQLVPLVEVCGGVQTAEDAVTVTMELLALIEKKPVRMKKEILGFIGNRLMHAMYREALSMIDKGIVDAEGIDQAVLTSFGPRFANLGPMEYLDFLGLDLIERVQHYLYGDLDRNPGVTRVIERLNRENKLGAKTGTGLMDWHEKDRDSVRTRRDAEFFRRLEES